MTWIAIFFIALSIWLWASNHEARREQLKKIWKLESDASCLRNINKGLVDKNFKLQQSLHFYANLESWYARSKDHCSDRRAYVYSHAFKDYGQKARDALGIKEVKPFTDHF